MPLASFHWYLNFFTDYSIVLPWLVLACFIRCLFREYHIFLIN
uniref:Uncharacterized protein n=1 Tax=Arundo donax TaxID=35708 RepID=A0A0A9FPT7_ARUDO